MKRFFVGIVLIIMLLSLSMTAFAAVTITEQNGSQQIDIQAKAVYINPENMYSQAVLNGSAGITTEGGTTITVATDDTILDGLTLNVIEMLESDHEAYAWISGIMDGVCNMFIAFDIYFTDSDGNRIPVTGDVTVSVTTPDGYTNIKVYHISSDSTKNMLTSVQSGENTVFTAESFSYYLLTDNQPETDDPLYPTDDTASALLWLSLSALCGGIITLYIIKRRKNASAE